MHHRDDGQAGGPPRCGATEGEGQGGGGGEGSEGEEEEDGCGHGMMKVENLYEHNKPDTADVVLHNQPLRREDFR